ncbi:MAG: class I SAM-dependent methyltransferase [Limisphaerales bacterium]
MTADLLAYYNDHPDYVALRSKTSEFYRQYVNEVKYWKNKYLYELVQGREIASLCEVGCATGILLAEFPSATPASRRYGVDVSSENIEAAASDYPELNFFAGRFEEFLKSGSSPARFDLIILSDILEHVEDDAGLLALAGSHASHVVLNLPLEKCAEFQNRKYGFQDKHGHLRAYGVEDAESLVERAGLVVEKSLVRQYVLEPVFRRYLAGKLFGGKRAEEQVGGIARYLEELNEIDLNRSHYKSNYFGLLRRKDSTN